MSYDLFAFNLEALDLADPPTGADEIQAVLNDLRDQEYDRKYPSPPVLSRRLAALCEDLEQWFAEDPPWVMYPLSSGMEIDGCFIAFYIGWARASEVLPAVLDTCQKHGVIFIDPQVGGLGLLMPDDPLPDPSPESVS